MTKTALNLLHNIRHRLLYDTATPVPTMYFILRAHCKVGRPDRICGRVRYAISWLTQYGCVLIIQKIFGRPTLFHCIYRKIVTFLNFRQFFARHFPAIINFYFTVIFTY
jgi:hypothetical protein